MDFLLVEDNEIAATMIKKNLELLGFRVDIAKTGHEGIKLSKRGYDIILLDIGLPDINGLEVARAIRRKERYRNTIIGISGYGELLRDECLRVGFTEVYRKPATQHELIEILKSGIPNGKRKKIHN